jgi:hypothetical protein
MENQQADYLAKAAVTFVPPTILKLKYHIEMRHRPLIPNNVQHWKVFEDEEKIKQFLEMIDELFETHIDQENQNDPIWVMKEGEDPEEFQDKNENHRIIMLKNNKIPRVMIPLERLFDQDDITLKYTLRPQPKEVEDCNIGTKEDPKLVKISKYLPSQMKNKYDEFLK